MKAQYKFVATISVLLLVAFGFLDSAHTVSAAAGAKITRPVKDQFYGERSGTVRDPFGHEWLLGGHLEDVSTEEMQRRYTALFEK